MADQLVPNARKAPTERKVLLWILKWWAHLILLQGGNYWHMRRREGTHRDLSTNGKKILDSSPSFLSPPSSLPAILFPLAFSQTPRTSKVGEAKGMNSQIFISLIWIWFLRKIWEGKDHCECAILVHSTQTGKKMSVTYFCSWHVTTHICRGLGKPPKYLTKLPGD